MALLIVVWLGQAKSEGHNGTTGVLTRVAERGTLEITVVEQGNLRSASNIDVKCEVEMPEGTQIIWLFPDGEFVRKGDKIVELDRSALKQKQVEQLIAVETARKDLYKAQNSFEAAKIAVDEYQFGVFESERQELEAEMAVAEENLRRAEEFARHTQAMYTRGFSSSAQRQADMFAVKNAQLTLKALRTKLNALAKYTKAKTVAELTGERESADAEVKAGMANLQLEESKLTLIQNQLDRCTIKAPKDGMVVYANDAYWLQEPQIQEGAFVRFRQTIIRLPELSQMEVEAKVHESMIQKVQSGQRVRIIVDALPNQYFDGIVKKVNNQPTPNRLSDHVKEYIAVVAIDRTVEGLKPGMTAEVTIFTDRIEDVVLVPVQAVVPKGKSRFCYVVNTDGRIEERAVLIGASNDVFIEIRDGVGEGDMVVLNARTVVPEARMKRSEGSAPITEGIATRSPRVGEP